jgi:hypothetical protein
MNSEPLSSENDSAKTLDDVEVAEDSGDQTTEKMGGKRVRKPTARYEGFWRHRNDVSWESGQDLARFRDFLHPRYAETLRKIVLRVYRCETGDSEHFLEPVNQSDKRLRDA